MDMSLAEPFTFGLNSGCEFFNSENCFDSFSEGGGGRYFYCRNESSIACDPSHTARGHCVDIQGEHEEENDGCNS